MNNNGNLLRTPNKFWILLVGAVMTGVVAFATLKGQVNALESDFRKDSEVLQQTHDAVIRMEKDIEFIKENL